jgi:hypothetical protein
MEAETERTMGATMTDEERKALAANEIERLAALAQSDAEPICKICGGSGYTRHLGRDNSEEVENCSCRQQSDAEPVAWQYRWRIPGSVEWTNWSEISEFAAKRYIECDHNNEVRPLYTAPPRPDARSDTRKRFDAFAEALDPPRPDTSAGLIEAAEIALAIKGNAYLWATTDAGQEGFLAACNNIAQALRARAADRSEK